MNAPRCASRHCCKNEQRRFQTPPSVVQQHWGTCWAEPGIPCWADWREQLGIKTLFLLVIFRCVDIWKVLRCWCQLQTVWEVLIWYYTNTFWRTCSWSEPPAVTFCCRSWDARKLSSSLSCSAGCIVASQNDSRSFSSTSSTAQQ